MSPTHNTKSKVDVVQSPPSLPSPFSLSNLAQFSTVGFSGFWVLKELWQIWRPPIFRNVEIGCLGLLRIGGLGFGFGVLINEILELGLRVLREMNGRAEKLQEMRVVLANMLGQRYGDIHTILVGKVVRVGFLYALRMSSSFKLFCWHERICWWHGEI